MSNKPNISNIQGNDFDIIATNIKGKELIDKKLNSTSSSSLIISFPDEMQNNSYNCELLVTDTSSYIYPIIINSKYDKPLKKDNNNIKLSYNSEYFAVNKNDELTLSSNVISNLNQAASDVNKVKNNTEQLNTDINATKSQVNTIDNTVKNLSTNYDSLNNAALTKQKRITINIDNPEEAQTSDIHIFEEENTIYDIAGDMYFLDNIIKIGNNSTLKFSGGTISNATLIGNNTEIISSKYKIFKNVTLKNSFTTSFCPEWFGAKGDNINNDAQYINELNNQNCNNHIIKLNNSGYKIDKLYINHDIYINSTINTILDKNSSITFENCKVIFSDNGIIKNANIKFINAEIIASNCKIFENVTFVKNSTIKNTKIPVEWFGAKGDNINDDSKAINDTIEQSYNLYITDDLYENTYKSNISTYPIIELSNNIYNVNNTIHIYKDKSKFICYGTIATKNNITVLEICGDELDININSIRQFGNFISQDNKIETGLSNREDPQGFGGIGVKIQQRMFNSNININIIERFNYGILIAPRVFKDSFNTEIQTGNKYHPNKLFAGIQYCKFNFQYITAVHCITLDFDLENDPDKELFKGYENNYEPEEGSDILPQWFWVNENQFNGGRLFCAENKEAAKKLREKAGIGIEVKGCNIIVNSNPVGLLYGGIDGNIFNYIGFEGLWTAIKLWKSKFHIFNDIRMCESLFAGTYPNEKNIPWIDLDECEDCKFNIKGLIPMDKIKLNNCKENIFNGHFTEPNASYSEDIFGYTNNRFTKLYGDNAIKKYIINGKSTIVDNPSTPGCLGETDYFSGIIPINEISNKNLIHLIETSNDNIYNTSINIENINYKLYNFNNLLFKHIKYNIDDTTSIDYISHEMSDILKIKVQENTNIIIDFKNSIWSLYPDVKMYFSLDKNSSVTFIHGLNENNTIETPIYFYESKVNVIKAESAKKEYKVKLLYQLNQSNIQNELILIED